MLLTRWVSTSVTPVENVPVVVNIKALRGRCIAHKLSAGWEVGVVKSVEKKESVTGQFADKYKS